jgi:SOS-response transcriptional repressor LexA
MASGAFSWNSELPSGRNPFWIRDEALAGLGLHVGDAVSVDTRAEPREGDLVVVEVELDDDSVRTARRWAPIDDERVRLEGVGGAVEPIEVGTDRLIVMGVVAARLRLTGTEAIEEPLAGTMQ